MTDLANAGQGAESQANPPSQAESNETVVPQEVQAKFDKVFGPRGDEPAKPKAKEAAPVQQHRPATNRRAERNQTRRAAAAKEQENELEEAAEAAQPSGSDEAEQPAEQQQAAEGPGQEPPAQPAEEDVLSTLDPVLRHAARRMGWEDDKIGRFYKADPDLAEETFERFHAQLNDLSVRYAQLGQQQHVQPAPQPYQQRAGQQPQQHQPQQVDGSMLDRLFSNDLDEFRAVHGDDFVDKLLIPLQREIIEPFREAYQFVQQQQQQLLFQQVNSVFDALSGEGFDDLYGQTGKESAEQVQAKQQVLQLADQVRAGARHLTVAQAIDHAHTILTAQRRGEHERKKLTEQVRGRSQRLTARPTQRRVAKTVEDGANRSFKSAIEAYTQRAAELGVAVDGEE